MEINTFQVEDGDVEFAKTFYQSVIQSNVVYSKQCYRSIERRSRAFEIKSHSDQVSIPVGYVCECLYIKLLLQMKDFIYMLLTKYSSPFLLHFSILKLMPFQMVLLSSNLRLRTNVATTKDPTKQKRARGALQLKQRRQRRILLRLLICFELRDSLPQQIALRQVLCIYSIS